MGRIDFYNRSNNTLYASCFRNDDDNKSVPLNHRIHGGGGDGGMAPNEHIYFDELPDEYVQVVINTRDGDRGAGAEITPTRGYLVTDMVTSGDRAWVYIGGQAGAWDFRAGAGHKHRVKMQPVAFFTPQWIRDSDGAMLKGSGSGGGGDAWPVWFGIPPAPEGAPNSPSSLALFPSSGHLYQLNAGSGLDLSRYNTNGTVERIASIGTGWNVLKHFFAARDGYLYGIDNGNRLLAYHHNESGHFDMESRVIGGGWDFHQVMAGAFGQIYAIEHDGRLVYYEHDQNFSFRVERRVIGSGWKGIGRVIPGGANCLYNISPSGALLLYRHDSNLRFVDEAKVIGGEFGGFPQVASGGNGEILAVQPNGTLRAYRHDASGTFYNGQGIELHGVSFSKDNFLVAATR